MFRVAVVIDVAAAGGGTIKVLGDTNSNIAGTPGSDVSVCGDQASCIYVTRSIGLDLCLFHFSLNRYVTAAGCSSVKRSSGIYLDITGTLDSDINIVRFQLGSVNFTRS